jgi:hypothetical protein
MRFRLGSGSWRANTNPGTHPESATLLANPSLCLNYKTNTLQCRQEPMLQIPLLQGQITKHKLQGNLMPLNLLSILKVRLSVSPMT